MVITIKLFPKDATDFSTNGIKLLQPVSCVVSEEINADYSLTIVMPKGDCSIQAESIIKVPTPKGEQLFRIYSPDLNVLSNNTYYGRHIFYDLLDAFIVGKSIHGSGTAAITSILDSTEFSGMSDITTTNTAEYEMLSPVKAILGEDSSFINCWGGEIERDNFSVRMLQHVGADRGVTIRYRKNLTGLTVKTDLSSVVTRIYPTGRQSDGQTLLTLPEKFIDSSFIQNYAHPKIARYDYSDIKVVTEVSDSDPAIVTEAQAQQALRAAALAEYTNGIDKPTVSADVAFIPLETTEEYKDFAVLEHVYIGDTVKVYHEPLGLEFSLRVAKYEYDALTQRYTSVTLGTVLPSVGTKESTVGKAATAAQNTADEAAAGVSEAKASIETLNGEIVLKVSKDSVVSSINLSTEGIVIKADKLDLTGLVTISNLENGNTVIDGGCITTGKIQSENGDYWVSLETGEVYMKNGTFAGTVKWGDEAYISRDETSGDITLRSSAGGTPEINIDAGNRAFLNLTGAQIRLDGTIHTYDDGWKKGMTTQVGITTRSGGKRTLQFTNGILTDNDVEGGTQ